MSADPVSDKAPPAETPAEKGIKIFTYPKVIFLYPTLVVALICGVGMAMIADETRDPKRILDDALTPVSTDTPAVKADKADAKKADVEAKKADAEAKKIAAARVKTADPQSPDAIKKERILKRFGSPQNLLGIAFLAVFAFNILVIAMDFPRFTLLAVILLVFMVLFFMLWLGAYFDVLTPLAILLESVYVVANAQFYFWFAAILFFGFAFVYMTRWLDYWEILPNEILHHHGPLSDLERYPTFNVKFDKEIPDILEFMMLGSGKLILHVANADRPIVLDTVPFINRVEEKLKNLMSRMEVRLAPDATAPQGYKKI